MITFEMVDWFNAVDTTCKAALRDLIEVQAQRFDAKLEQRLAETCADRITWMFLFWLGTVAATLAGICAR